jgi:ABC-type nitrate/sulfonate/bicarbonate transport system ATPase subunit
MNLLSFNDIRLAYNSNKKESTILHNINLQVRPGEFVTIVGPSGCGKSSLLRLAAGVQQPTAGSILFNGKPICGTDAKRVMMFQDAALFPWMTVEQNVAFGLKIQGLKKKYYQPKIFEFLSHMDLIQFAKHRPYELSGGMKQRVALARTLIIDPELVMMDEPFAALDCITRGRMHRLVKGIWDQTGKSILFVTHDIEEAVKLGTRVILISSRPGTILEDIPLSSGGLAEDVQIKARIDYIYERLAQDIGSRIPEQNR